MSEEKGKTKEKVSQAVWQGNLDLWFRYEYTRGRHEHKLKEDDLSKAYFLSAMLAYFLHIVVAYKAFTGAQYLAEVYSELIDSVVDEVRAVISLRTRLHKEEAYLHGCNVKLLKDILESIPVDDDFAECEDEEARTLIKGLLTQFTGRQVALIVGGQSEMVSDDESEVQEHGPFTGANGTDDESEDPQQ